MTKKRTGKRNANKSLDRNTKHIHHRHGVTLINKKEVSYTVYTVNMDRPNKDITVWAKTVKFGKDKSHRPGGYAFQVAAKEQEAQLV
jgi:hypothetical protein